MVEYNSKIKELEDRISSTKYNKKTQMAIGQYKAQLAKLKEKETTRGSGTSGGGGWEVRKTCDGTVILIGFPSASKSTLWNLLTEAKSEVKVEAKVAPKVVKTTASASVDHSKMTVVQLKSLCKDKGISGYSKLKKAELIQALK